MVNNLYLAAFAVYLLVVLGIGLWGWRETSSFSDFATTSQNLSLLLVAGSLFASFTSALSFIGGVGYASSYGWAVFTLFVTGSVAGMGFLTLTAKKWHQTRANSVTEFMEIRYDSKGLQAVLAIVVTVAYGIILNAQLLGIGFVVEGLIDIPMHWGILVMGLFFVAYTILGGMKSVARTDLLQAIIMGVGITVIFALVMWRIFTDPANSLSAKAELFTVYAGSTPDTTAILVFVFVYGLGVAVHPYYVQRLLAADDIKTARLAPAITGIGVIIMFIMISFVGITGAIYLPGAVGDSMTPAIVRDLIGGWVGAFLMLALLAGMQSTTDSTLHVVGSYVSQDIFGTYIYDDPSDATLLRTSRWVTGVFGIIVVALGAYQSFAGELELIAVIGAYGWSTLGAALFVPIAVGMFWRQATKEGAIASAVVGLLTGIGGQILFNQGILPVHQIIPATALGLVTIFVVSLFTEPIESPGVDRMFASDSD